MGLLDLFRNNTPFDKGQSCFRKGKLKEAAAFYSNAIEENDRPAIAALQLGLCYFQTCQFHEAERAFLVSSKENPSNPKAWELLSLTQAVIGKLEDAEVSARQALSCSIDAEQVFMSQLALVQALVAQVEKVGNHRSRIPESVEALQANIADIFECSRLMRRVEPEIEQLVNAKPEFDEVWKFVALLGIYSFDVKWMRRGMVRLLDLRSNYFRTLQSEYYKLYSYPMSMKEILQPNESDS